MSNPPPPGEPTPPGEPQPPQPPYVPPAGSVPPQPGQGTPPPPGYGPGYGQQQGYGQPGPDGYQQTGAYGYFPPPQNQAPNPAIDEAKGFFASLFDFSFTHFVTPKIVKFVYILVLVILVISWLFITVGAFIGGGYAYGGYGGGRIVAGLLALVGGPFIIILYLAIIRMTFEFYVAMIRTAENTGKLVEQGEKD